MPRFTPIKSPIVPVIVPMRNDAGNIVDAAIAAVPAEASVPPLQPVRPHSQELIMAREASRYALFAQHYGNGQKVKIPYGMMAVTLSVKFDNSDIQSDYFDRHASLSQDFVVLVVKKQAEKEALARRALALCPELHNLKWEWHTEKWSMGHGNYLESDGFELPAELCGLKNQYRGAHTGPRVECGHWEIEFARPYREGDVLELDAYKTFGTGAPAAKSSRSTVTAMTLVENEARQGIELHFPGKPSDEVLAEIHAANEPVKIWRFHFVKKIWYARNTPQNKAWAEAFVARHSGKPAAPAPVPATVQPDPAPAPAPEPERIVVPVDFNAEPAADISIAAKPAPTVQPIVPAWRRRTTI